jgi:hypothetical protein
MLCFMRAVLETMKTLSYGIFEGLVVFVAYDFFNALQNYFAGKKYCLFIFLTALKMISYKVKRFFLELGIRNGRRPLKRAFP